MKASLIITCKNEVENIEGFLESVIAQTKRPDDFVMRDAGSNDGTIDIIKRYTKKYKWMSLIIAPNTNIAQGRNLAIKAAKNDVIAVTDAGCRLDKNWFENITKPFKDKNVDLVAGVYKPLWKNKFEYYQGLVVCPEPKDIVGVSNISSRSIAFRKKCWKAVDGYPEKYDIGEDTLFNTKLVEKGYKFAYAKDAVVNWEMRKSWRALFKQFYRYGTWDRVTGNIFKLKINLMMVISFWGLITLSVLVHPIFIPALALSFLADFAVVTNRVRKKMWDAESVTYRFLVLFVKRIAYIVGVTFGIPRRY